MSIEDFIKVQQSPENNQKNLHYYRCLKYSRVSLNAKTILKSKRKGAEQLFTELLEQYQVPENLFPLVELQLTKLFAHYEANSASNENQLQKQLATLQSQLKQLKIRFGINEIDRETYEMTMEHLAEQIRQINKEVNSGNVIISNHEKLISESLKKLENISKIWGSSDLDGRRIPHKTLFPKSIFYNVEKHQYLTWKINGFVELVSSISTACSDNKKRNLQKNIENSCRVRETGKSSNQVLTDFQTFINL